MSSFIAKFIVFKLKKKSLRTFEEFLARSLVNRCLSAEDSNHTGLQVQSPSRPVIIRVPNLELRANSEGHDDTNNVLELAKSYNYTWEG